LPDARWLMVRLATFPWMLAAVALPATFARASDHLDSPMTVANPQADISDVYAWMAPEGRRLNVVMTMQGHGFSNKVQYVLHVDSGSEFGHTTASTAIDCRFAAADAVKCELGTLDSAAGDPQTSSGLEGRKHKFRVYAGLRDDPFYNNIKGLLGAYQAAAEAIKRGAPVDTAGCAHFDETATQAIRYQMTHTDGGPAQNFLGNWTVSAIVISVDLGALTKGGPLLAVWGTTSLNGKQIDHMARPFMANTVLGAAPFSADDASGELRQQFNAAAPGASDAFAAQLQKGLAFQDSLDGKCGNQLLAEASASPTRYHTLANLLVDDRLWLNSTYTECRQFFAVESAALAGRQSSNDDCGGRSPTYDTSNTWRSLFIAGTASGITDGLQQDEHPPSATIFPFLAPPDAHGIDH
jgi:hypothetical protein